MNKNILGVILTVVAVVGVAGIVIANKQDGMGDMDTSYTNQTAEKPKDGNPFTNPGKDMSSDQVQQGEVKMDIAGFAFSQKAIKVKKGTKVTWTNKDSAKHDISPDMESPGFKASELLAKGENYSFTFDTAGKYAYHCSPHPYMKASVEVVE